MTKRVAEGKEGFVQVFGRLFPFVRFAFRPFLSSSFLFFSDLGIVCVCLCARTGGSLVAASVVWAHYSKVGVLQHPQLWIGSFGLLCGNVIVPTHSPFSIASSSSPPYHTILVNIMMMMAFCCKGSHGAGARRQAVLPAHPAPPVFILYWYALCWKKTTLFCLAGQMLTYRRNVQERR
jgi:hypothetical protein